ncbi:glycosyltransferase [Dysgonomonas capnocytophagoides]|uniref:Glycosyltransferase n=1 Tax=Dysgonomonas capnocytophagoides TaxID=45254 RepID=A0A4Y8L9R8_9BACT|nr:glycosyltransferase [Dysgonomonas capnocytophagoides]TFD97780.1 glycosyltransferase [Dysgonomonas capnocytophagoides]
MRFSFITCTYNRDKYIGQTLQSVCDQKYPDNNYEIIVIDNNSTDNTASICEEFRAEYPNKNFRYFKEMNQGLSFALNRGIKEAQGEFLIFVDDDETIIPEHLERLDNHLRTYPEAVLCGTPVIPVYEIPEPKWMSRFTQRLIGGYFDQGKEVKILEAKNYPGTGHTIIKKELYERYGNYNTELGRKGTSLIGAEDKDMFNRLKNNNIVCYYLPDIPIYHHIPPNKMTDEFFHKLTYSIGKSERIRTKAVSEKEFRNRLLSEGIKWGASVVLFAGYTLGLQPSKGFRLLQFRWNVTKGLLGK